MLTIKLHGNRAVLEGDVPDKLERDLQARFCWVNPDDLEDVVYFYADRVMYSGVAEPAARFIGAQGFDVELALPELPPKDFEATMTRPPRPMHQRVVDAVIDQSYGYVKAPPGVGKTSMMVQAICEIGLAPAFIVVQNERPFTQALNTILDHSTIDSVGRIGDNKKEVRDVNVCMVQTLQKELENNPDGPVATAWKNAKVVFVDEQHHGGADGYVKVFDHLSNIYYLVGFSATPQRPDEHQDRLEAVLGTEIASISRAEALDHGLNVPLTVFIEDMPRKSYGFVVNGRNVVPNRRRKGQKTPYEQVYDDYIIYNEARNKAALEFCYDAIDQNFSVCICVSRVEHIEELQRLEPTITALHAKTKNRDEIFEKMTRKEIMLVASTLMDEAVDVPSLSCVIMLAGGKSPVKLEQRIRCDRTFSGDTAFGHFEKKRGYIWFPRDTADFLTSHSNENIKILKRICDEHPLHELWVNDQLVPRGRAVPLRPK